MHSTRCVLLLNQEWARVIPLLGSLSRRLGWRYISEWLYPRCAESWLDFNCSLYKRFQSSCMCSRVFICHVRKTGIEDSNSGKATFKLRAICGRCSIINHSPEWRVPNIVEISLGVSCTNSQAVWAIIYCQGWWACQEFSPSGIVGLLTAINQPYLVTLPL